MLFGGYAHQEDAQIMNQTPEQLARDNIDRQLAACGWIVQDKIHIDLSAGAGVAIREYYTDIGPADYILFVDCRPVGEARQQARSDKTRPLRIAPSQRAVETLEKAGQEWTVDHNAL
jgi:type I restriction enzyme, R subunit